MLRSLAHMSRLGLGRICFFLPDAGYPRSNYPACLPGYCWISGFFLPDNRISGQIIQHCRISGPTLVLANPNGKYLPYANFLDEAKSFPPFVSLYAPFFFKHFPSRPLPGSFRQFIFFSVFSII